MARISFIESKSRPMHFYKKDLQQTPKIKRLNIINSLTGIKPGNLIGTKSNSGQSNLAVFSSIVHLGSNPALFGFILRPYHEVPRHTYANILENGHFTLNHIPAHLTQNAHYTSVKFEDNVSEFEACGFTEEYKNDFWAPYVKESTIKIGLKHVESLPIKINNTTLVIGEIEHVYCDDSYINENGYIDLEKASSAGISGLNSYYSLNKIDSYPYARAEELPDFK